MAKLAPNNQLRATRESKQLSREQLAEQINTHRLNIGRWERGNALPDLYFIDKLCAFFDMSAEELGFSLTTSQSLPVFKQAIYDPAIPLQPAMALVGRAQQIAQLKHDLKGAENTFLMVLHGLPGVGKTTVATELAYNQEIRKHFSDGILWAGLGANPNIQGQLRRWGKLLGLSNNTMDNLNNSETWAIALRTAIGTKHMLLIIDDAWQVEESLTFKVGGPNCAHLVTTRFPAMAMHMHAEHITVIQELNETDSMTLLHMLAPQVIEHETKKASALVQAVGGLPLALTLMGNYLRQQAYSGQTRRIQTALQRLSAAEGRLQISEPRSPLEHHPSIPTTTLLSLQSIIAVTDQQLSVEARTALYALAVLPSKPDTFSEETAIAITGCSLDAIDELIDAGILETSNEGRYMLHQTLADYARFHLQGIEPHERLIQYAHDFVETHRADYELLDLESGTIIAALETAYTLKKQEELVRNVCEFIPFLLVHSNYALAERHMQRARQASLALNDKHGIISTLLYQGQIAHRQGNYTQAMDPQREGLQLARQIDNPERISALLHDLGWATWRSGEYTQAEEYLHEGLQLARQIEHHERTSGILMMLGTVAARVGNYPKSEIFLQEGLKLARLTGEREQICRLLLNLGVTVGEQGNYKQAEIYFQEGLILARQIGQREVVSVLLNNIGDAAEAQGNYAQAEIYFQEGLSLVRQIGHREWASALLSNLGLTARKQGNYIQAEVYLQESLTLARQNGRFHMTCNTLYEYGNLQLDQHDVEAAEASFSEILATLPEEVPDLSALAQYGLARVAAARDNLPEALELGEVSAHVLETIGLRNAQEVRLWLDSIKGK